MDDSSVPLAPTSQTVESSPPELGVGVSTANHSPESAKPSPTRINGQVWLVIAALLALVSGLALGVVVRRYQSSPVALVPVEQVDKLADFAGKFGNEVVVRNALKLNVFEDSDGNGQRNGQEQAIDQIRVSLRPLGGTVTQAVTTDYTGEATFFDLSKGNYEMMLEWQASGDSSSQTTFHPKQFSYQSAVLPTSWLKIEVPEVASGVAVPLQAYRPPYLEVVDYGLVVVFNDLTTGRQVGWVRTSNQGGNKMYKRYFVLNNRFYFIDDAGKLQGYHWLEDKLTTEIAETGLVRDRGFEYWHLSPGGKTMLHATPNNFFKRLNVQSGLAECNTGALSYGSEPLSVNTGSNPHYPFEAALASDRQFAVIAMKGSDTTPRLYIGRCDSGGWQIVETRYQAGSHLRWANDDQLMLSGFEQKTDTVSQSFDGAHVFTLSSSEVRKIGYEHMLIESANHPNWLISYGEAPVGLRLISDLLSGNNRRLTVDSGFPLTSGAEAQRTFAWPDNHLFVLKAETCKVVGTPPRQKCGQLYHLELVNDRLVLRDTWDHVDQSTVLTGVLRGNE